MPKVSIANPKKMIPKFTALLSQSDAAKVLPTFPEILLVFDNRKLSQGLVEHSMAVACVAVSIAQWLNASRGRGFDAAALAAAALLHDVEKSQPDHAAKGAAFVQQLGYVSLAPMIAEHMKIDFPQGSQLTEAAILYVADKVCKGANLIGLEERLAQSIAAYGDLAGVQEKFKAAFIIRDIIIRSVDKQYISAKEKIIWETIQKKE